MYTFNLNKQVMIVNSDNMKILYFQIHIVNGMK